MKEIHRNVILAYLTVIASLVHFIKIELVPQE